MDRGRVIYRVTEVYVVGLVLAAVLTALWLVLPEMAAVPQLAGIWFALAGFGSLVVALLVFMYYAR